jgi:hypothetical protein
MAACGSSTDRIDDDGNCIAQELAERLGVTLTAQTIRFTLLKTGS